MAGAGNSPLGVGPYGAGTPTTATPPGGSVNRDARGVQLGSVAISLDPGSRGQYVYDEFGRRAGSNDVPHMVTIALGTVRGTCVVADLGHRFREVRKVNEAFPAEISTRVQEALANLVRLNLVKIDAVLIDPNNGAPSGIRVHLTDLTTNAPIVATV